MNRKNIIRKHIECDIQDLEQLDDGTFLDKQENDIWDVRFPDEHDGDPTYDEFEFKFLGHEPIKTFIKLVNEK